MATAEDNQLSKDLTSLKPEEYRRFKREKAKLKLFVEEYHACTLCGRVQYVKYHCEKELVCKFCLFYKLKLYQKKPAVVSLVEE